MYDVMSSCRHARNLRVPCVSTTRLELFFNCLQTNKDHSMYSGRCLIKFVPRRDRNDPEHSLLCYHRGYTTGQTGMILNILYFVTNVIPFTISPL